MAEAPIALRTVHRGGCCAGEILMARYVFVLRHSSFAVLQDGAAGMELPDDAAAREFAAKVMSGLVWQQEDNWARWTMEVWQTEPTHVPLPSQLLSRPAQLQRVVDAPCHPQIRRL